MKISKKELIDYFEKKKILNNLHVWETKSTTR